MTDSGEKNSILSDVEIKGTIRFSKELMFDGTLDGDVASHGGTLVIGGNGKIHGNIQANAVGGKRKGNGQISAQNPWGTHGGGWLIGEPQKPRPQLQAWRDVLG